MDDQQETIREIDIVAYKASLVRELHVYTVLIVSCKKSDENAWVLLSKSPNHSDPNMEWIPIHAWSNDPKLTFMFEEQEWKETYLSSLNDNQSFLVSHKPRRHIFGFQEMKKESGAPQNDKNIFNSVTSVMKAQAYEMNALPLRKKDPCVFQFNLISVAQTDLIRLDFEKDTVDGEAVDDEIYVAGYIIEKQQTFARVHFVNSEKFDAVLKAYNKLHEANKSAFMAVYDKFCKEVIKDSVKLNLFRKDVAMDIWWIVHQNFRHLTGLNETLRDGWLFWNQKEQSIDFYVDLDAESIAEMNSNIDVMKALSKSPKKHYQYEGRSGFVLNDIPF